MSSAARVTPLITAEQYLELERRAEYKSEFVDGRIYAMTGASREHNLISLNVATALRTQLRGRKCETYASDMRVRVVPGRAYLYPDVVVACGEIRFEDELVDTLLDPTVVVEILSPSTEAHDRGRKALRYRELASLRTYVLVSQTEPIVECYERDDAAWRLTTIVGLDATVELRSIECAIPMAAVYEGVEVALDES